MEKANKKWCVVVWCHGSGNCPLVPMEMVLTPNNAATLSNRTPASIWDHTQTQQKLLEPCWRSLYINGATQSTKINYIRLTAAPLADISLNLH